MHTHFSNKDNDLLESFGPKYYIVTYRFSDYCLSKVYKLGYLIDSLQSTTGFLSSHVRAIKTIKG